MVYLWIYWNVKIAIYVKYTNLAHNNGKNIANRTCFDSIKHKRSIRQFGKRNRHSTHTHPTVFAFKSRFIWLNVNCIAAIHSNIIRDLHSTRITTIRILFVLHIVRSHGNLYINFFFDFCCHLDGIFIFYH